VFVIIGSITADVFVFSPDASIDRGADGFKTSNLVFTERPPAFLMGGNGGNSAYVSAGLDVPTSLFGAVGRDLLGRTLLNWLSSQGVDVDAVLRSETHATSSSIIVTTDPTSQIVFHHPGATRAAHPEHLPLSQLHEASVLLCSSFPLITNLRPHGFARALEVTHGAGGLTALDIGPAIGEPVTLDELAPLLPDIDYLIGNTHELATIAQESSCEAAARRLLDVGASCVVVKRGQDGAYLTCGDERVAVPAFPVDARISVGAGDSFNVGFLYAIHRGWSAREAVRFGNAVAALVVSSDRGVLGAPTLDDVQAFLAER
jgi:ribokinase